VDLRCPQEREIARPTLENKKNVSFPDKLLDFISQLFEGDMSGLPEAKFS